MPEEYKFRIKELTLGRDQRISVKPINIVIGPNSCGKSQLLKDIRDILRGQMSQRSGVIVKRIDFDLPPSVESFVSSYIPDGRIYNEPYSGQVFTKTYSGLSNQNQTLDTSIRALVDDQNSKVHLGDKDSWRVQLENLLNNPDEANVKNQFITQYGKLFMVYTGTKEKLLVVERSARYGSNESEINLLSEYNIYTDKLDELYENVRILFGKELLLDNTGAQFGRDLVFRIGRVGDNLKLKNGNELQDYPLLEDDGDGIKDYVAVFLTANTENKDVILIDEPETFLHSPMLPSLGRMLSQCAESHQKQIFISTHSSRLVEEILKNARPGDINVIRLTRETDSGEFSVLKQSVLQRFAENHIVSASGAIEGLFAKRVYIVESEADKIFYSLLYVLTDVNPLDEALFISAVSGKDTMHKFADLYESLGVKYDIITDFDFISASNDNRRGSSLIKPFLEKDNSIASDKLDEFIQLEQRLKDNPNVNMKNGGFDTVPENERSLVEELLTALRRNHVRVLPSGELESSLTDVGVEYTANKNVWLKNALEKLHDMQNAGEDLKELEVYKSLFSD